MTPVKQMDVFLDLPVSVKKAEHLEKGLAVSRIFPELEKFDDEPNPVIVLQHQCL